MHPRLLPGHPWDPPEGLMFETIFKTISKNADSTLMIDSFDGRSYTFGEVHKKASAFSAGLKKLGIRDGDIVTIASNVTVESYIAIFGTWLSGASTACINPLLPKDELLVYLKVCKGKAIFTAQSFLEKVQEAVAGLDWEMIIIAPDAKDPLMDFNQMIAEPAELVTHVDQPLGKDHCVTILFTSGTTGVPKGVVCTDRMVQYNATTVSDWPSGDRPLTTSPLYWISSLMSWSVSLLEGKTLIITDGLGPKELLKVIHDYKPTLWFTGPATLMDMCQVPDLDRYDTSSLEALMVGGAAVYAEHRRHIREKLLRGRSVLRSCYGSTEGGFVSVDRVDVPPDSPQFSSIGQALRGSVIKIADPDTGEILPPHKIGEICVKSAGIINRYINKEITEDELDKDGFWHMGDLGYYDEEEYLYYHSRAKELMKFRGYQIAPAELESVLYKHPDVVEAAVVGKISKEYGDLPTAFVVLKAASKVTEKELADFVEGQVVDQKKLRGGVYIVESLPRSHVGKLLRRVLQDKVNS